MPLDCLPVSFAYCVPPAYEEVWIPGPVAVRVTPDRTPYVITDAMRDKAGAQINSLNTDAMLPVKPEGFQIRNIGDMRLYYRTTCDTALRCTFRTAAIRPEQRPLVEKYGIVPDGLEIIGANGPGFEKALNSINFVVKSDDGEMLIPLADLMPGR